MAPKDEINDPGPASRRQALSTMGRLALAPIVSGGLIASGSTPAAAQSAAPALPTRDAPPIGSLIALPRTRLIDGTVREPDFWKGKVLVLELWATWCPFCRKQNPVLDQLYREQVGKGLEVLGLSIDRNEDEIKKYYAETGYRFPSTRFDRAWWEAIGKPKGLPIIWVIGRDGRLAQVEIGELFAEDILDFARLL